MTIITDGIGRGNSAKVDSDNRLAVDAGTRSAGAIRSLIGDAYSVNSSLGTTAVDTLPVSTTFGYMVYISNTSSTKSIIIDKVTVTSDSVDLQYKSYLNITVGTIAVASSFAPTNLNTSSAKAASVDVHVWNSGSGTGMTGFSSGSVVTSQRLTTGTTVLDDDDTIIIGPSGSFTISMQNKGTGVCNTGIGVRFYEVSL